MPKEESGPDWRHALDGYLAPRSGEPQPGTLTGLALQFQVRELLPRTANRWNGPTSRAIGARSGDDVRGSGEFRLGVRPVTRTGRGWARGSLTWSNLPHVLHRMNLDPAQHRWFSQFGALHRATTPPTVGQDPDWIFLDEFLNPVLWELLRQAAPLAVPFVGTGGTAIRLAGTATLTLDVGGSDGGLRVRPMLLLDGQAPTQPRARPVGDHGVYLFDPEAPRSILLAECDERLDAERLALLRDYGRGDREVLVPPEGVEEFLTGYLPELRERMEVTSADAAVPLPPLPPPVLVLTATFGAKHSLGLVWRWERHRRSAEPPALAEVLPADLLPEQWLEEEGTVPLPASLTDLEAAEFAATVLPRIDALPGVRVDSVGTRPDYRELTGTPMLTVTTVPSEKHDWFDLGVVVTVDGRTVPFTPLFKALAKGRRKILLADGGYLALNHPAFGPLRELIEEAKDLAEWETRPTISRYQTSLWSDFEDLADEARPAVEWRSLLTDVRDEAPRPLDPPPGLHAALRPYQSEGFAWLAFLWRYGLGGILADDMGLGKTLQVLTLVQHVAEQGPKPPFLVIAPTSVVSNWVAEAARFTPGLVVRSITATEAKSGTTVASVAAGAHIVVTSYALLRLDFDAYQAAAAEDGWAGLVLDEAQFVKNAASRAHECARDLAVRFKLAVTGTPMENSLTELHALFAIVAPGLFASARKFAEDYVRPIEQPQTGITRGVGAGDAPAATAGLRADRLTRLRRRMRPFLLRRTKELVAAELPPKQEQVLSIDLAPEHRALYDLWLQRERRKLFNLLDDMDRNRFIVFRSLTLLRLLALDAVLLGDEHAGAPSSKLDALMEQLDDVLAEGHRALVFSQFTSYLSIVAARFDAAGIRYAYLDGSTRNRDAAIEEFRTGGAQVFLISLKAGGFGLNLTEADYVFLLDPWWNPASESQAIDRTHRIGQDKQVMVYRLVAAGTIEEKVMALKERKAAVFDAVVDDEALFSSLLTADDVRGLLG
jgi:superfamily II DNA or RNA helicase